MGQASHAAGYMLNPKYHSHYKQIFQDHVRQQQVRQGPRGKTTLEELEEGLTEVAERLLAGDQQRMERFVVQLNDYRNKKGRLQLEAIWSDTATAQPWEWWATHATSLDVLCYVAMRVLGQPSSSSACEHNWSTFEFIWNDRRNRLAGVDACTDRCADVLTSMLMY